MGLVQLSRCYGPDWLNPGYDKTAMIRENSQGYKPELHADSEVRWTAMT